MKLRNLVLSLLVVGVVSATGCKKENRFGLVEANPKKVIAVVDTLDADGFEKLNHVEKSQALEIITKVHSIEYLIAPDQVALEIPQRSEYTVALFKKHDTPEVTKFLGQKFYQHLDNAKTTMGDEDAKLRGREQRLINMLAKQYLQALIVENSSEAYRDYLAKAGPNSADDPYTTADSLLVHASGEGYVQLYLSAAREGDDAKMAEYRAKIEAVVKPFEDNTADYTPPRKSLLERLSRMIRGS